MNSHLLSEFPHGLDETALAALNDMPDSYQQSPFTHSPDGLDEEVIDALIEATDRQVDLREPTSAFLAGKEARRRDRRVIRQKIRLVQPLPIRATTPDPDGWAA